MPASNSPHSATHGLYTPFFSNIRPGLVSLGMSSVFFGNGVVSQELLCERGQGKDIFLVLLFPPPLLHILPSR